MPTSPITARVYEAASPTTLIDALAKSAERGWVDPLNQTGTGKLKVHALDPVLADLLADGETPEILAYDNIVRLALNGTDRFAFIIEARDPPPTTEGEQADRWWGISGRGVLALLSNAIVHTEGPVTGSHARQRRFDFTALAYDDSTWIAATELQTQGSTSGAEQRWYGLPESWPDPDAFWIWSRDRDGAYPAGKMPPGTSYFRKEFTLADDTDVAIFATCDNAFQLFLNGDAILDGGEWQQTYRVNQTLLAGTYEIAVVGTNTPTAAVSAAAPAGPAGLLVSVIEVDEVGTLTTNIILDTDATWLCLDYPTVVPGMTVGKILRLLIEEAQDRGALVGVTLGFTDTDDSNSEAWPSEPDIALDIGTPYLDVVRTFVEQYVDVEMTPELVFNVYIKGTLGLDLTGSVELTIGEDFEELLPEGQGHLTNAILARDTTGALTVRENAASLATRIRKESYLELALAPTDTRAQEMSDEVLVEFADPSVQTRCKVKEASGPYTTWKKGDLIRVPKNQTPIDATVLSIAVDEDQDTGWPIYHIEVSQDDI